MRVLIACEQSGIVREAFKKLGHKAWSCDLEPSAIPGTHYQGEVLKLLEMFPWDHFDLLIGFPECRFLCNSGVHLLTGKSQSVEKKNIRWENMYQARKFFMELLECKIVKICLENPVPHSYADLPKYTQTIQPWQFGEDASKRTCLWLKNLPKLEYTDVIIKEVYANQTPSGQNKLGPSGDRARLRAKTYQGIADAMAQQWGE